MDIQTYAEILGISLQSARAHCRKGKIPASLEHSPRRHWNIHLSPEEALELAGRGEEQQSDKLDKQQPEQGAISPKAPEDLENKRTDEQLSSTRSSSTLSESEGGLSGEGESSSRPQPDYPVSWEPFLEDPAAAAQQQEAEGQEQPSEKLPPAQSREIYLSIVQNALPEEYERGQALWEIWAEAMSRKFPMESDNFDWLAIIGIPAIMCKDRIAGFMGKLRGGNR